ncbi:trifunctional histidinol dehydrogenase/phosphoribosyl-AMP cyclohydrolase/phosphoribosyl-ATP diphosphatase ASCRUDRAFT_9025 [Ascoidea rubescens DSM 1968]|uniref:Histidine biosynthesis trifunctional protein n=1 Tax=Ascoidea rubescens DSM 1968 TaxID=1344418 RepID=A0A1D2VE57_9ASCO|nr:hypothetical protein ASCRUDRAFT_9025 [Ascoidea rubescens DSM 1968]ODV59800.1 hypothetical protein ASCRUDRAFT_9025 [Ascoidea rubescens DSM 1968]
MDEYNIYNNSSNSKSLNGEISEVSDTLNLKTISSNCEEKKNVQKCDKSIPSVETSSISKGISINEKIVQNFKICIKFLFKKNLIYLIIGLFFTAWWISILSQDKFRKKTSLWLVPTVLWGCIIFRLATFFIPIPKYIMFIPRKCFFYLIQIRDKIILENLRLVFAAIFTIVVICLGTFIPSETEYSSRTDRLISFFGIFIILFCLWLTSNNRRKIKWHTVITGILFQYIIALFVLRTTVGYDIFNFISKLAASLLEFAKNGVAFVTDEATSEKTMFFFTVLPSILFFVALIHILLYWNIIQWAAKKFGVFFFWSMKVSGAEAIVATASPFIGQGESAILVKELVPFLTKAEIHQIMCSGFATISGSVLVAFIGLGINPQALVSSCVMSIPAALAVSKMRFPETEVSISAGEVILPETESNLDENSNEAKNVLQAFLDKGGKLGFNIACIVMTNCFLLIATVALINSLLTWFGAYWGIPNLTLELMFTYLLYPLAFLIGAPRNEILKISKLLSFKFIQNEFSAYFLLTNDDEFTTLSKRGSVIATYALCGFANIGSVGTQIGMFLLPALAQVNGGLLNEFSVVGPTLLKYSNETKDSIYSLLSTTNYNDLILDFDQTLDSDENLVIDLLNSGVSKVFVPFSNYLVDTVNNSIPSHRIGIKLTNISEISKEIANKFYSVIIPYNSQLNYNETSKSFKSGQNIFIDLNLEEISLTIDQIINLTSSNLIPIISTNKLSYDDSKISISKILISKLSSDRADGLYPTIVSDIYNNSLGLCYSSNESIEKALIEKVGVYQSRKHGLWVKGLTSGSTQSLISIQLDCDNDALKFVVNQSGTGFCHLNTNTCFGDLTGLSRLEQTLIQRKLNAPHGSYTSRLFNDDDLLSAKIKEEAEELAEAKSKNEIAWECADLFYFAITKLIKNGVSIADVERNLNMKNLKIKRRKGDAKPKFIDQDKSNEKNKSSVKPKQNPQDEILTGEIKLKSINVSDLTEQQVIDAISRPVQSTSNIMKLVNPIVENIKNNGDKALIELTEKFDRVKLSSSIIKAPFSPELYQLPKKIQDALDLSIENVYKFHKAQIDNIKPLTIETSKGVACSRFSRPIENVGLYIPGGTAVLPSTALMLGVPAQVAGCSNIIFASPPRPDGTLTPEVVYVAHKVGAKAIVLAGGAQAVAAMAYGTETIPKCDKILGPGNQFVTAAKMYVQNDTSALCSIDMPAGPSEVLVVADKQSDPDFVAADLLSQAEHGIDSQVILVAIDLNDSEIDAIDKAVYEQTIKLPREQIIRKCIDHSLIIKVKTAEEAFYYSNLYAPEHLILHLKDAPSYLPLVQHAGSVFVGQYTPESCGDYSSGTNHTLPTYGYARMYSGVNTSTFLKFITSQEVTEEGLKNIGPSVMEVADVEGLGAHRNAVRIRMQKLGLL